MKIGRVPILRLFTAIERRDDEARTISGPCYVQPDAGDGYVLPPDVMRAMTPGYLKFANVRVMHRAEAVGTATVEWEGDVAIMRATISDDDAWKKICDGVYKGFSIGVKPKKVKRASGKVHVIDGEWFETSIVDRPRDDTVFSIERSETGDPVEIEAEVDEEEPTIDVSRGMFETRMKAQEKSTLRYAAMECLGSVLYQIQESEESNKDSLVREACREFAEYIAPVISRAELSEEGAIERIDALGVEITTATETVTRLEGEVSSKDAEITRLATKVADLEKQPDPTQAKPFRISDETFLKRMAERKSAESDESQGEARDTAVKERSELMRRDWSKETPAAKDSALLRLSELNRLIEG